MHLSLPQGGQGSESMPESESISSFSVAQPGTPSFLPASSLSPPLTSPPIVSAGPASAAESPTASVPKIGGKPTSTWRQRLAEKEKQAAMLSPATTNVPLPETQKDVNGSEMPLEGKVVWRPRKLRDQA